VAARKSCVSSKISWSVKPSTTFLSFDSYYNRRYAHHAQCARHTFFHWNPSHSQMCLLDQRKPYLNLCPLKNSNLKRRRQGSPYANRGAADSSFSMQAQAAISELSAGPFASEEICYFSHRLSQWSGGRVGTTTASEGRVDTLLPT